MTQQPSEAPRPSQGVSMPADGRPSLGKRLVLPIVLFVVFGLGGTGNLVAWYYLWPSYTAVGVVEVGPGQYQLPGLLGIPQESGVPLPLFNAYVDAQVLAICNPRVLDTVIGQLKGKQHLFREPNASQELGLALEVNHQLGTQTIFVSLSGSDREQVQMIVAEILKQYTEQLRADQAQIDADRQLELRVARDDLRKQLDDLRRRLSSFRGEANLITASEQGSEQLIRLTGLVQRLSDAEVTLAETNADWNQFQEVKKLGDEAKDYTPLMLAFPEIMEALRTDPTIAALGEQASRLKRELAGMKQREEKDDAVRRAETAAQVAKNDCEAKQNEVLGQLFQQLAATLKRKHDRARAAEAELRARVAEARAAAVDNAQRTAEFRDREAEYQRVQSLYNTVMDGMERMRITAALSRLNVRIVRSPQIPIDPSEPRLDIYIPAVLAFSFVFALGLGLLAPSLLRGRPRRGSNGGRLGEG